MIKSVEKILSDAGKSMKRSAIREILKLLQKPGMISFAGRNTLRLNFSFSNTGEIEEGVKRLSQIINDELTGK